MPVSLHSRAIIEGTPAVADAELISMWLHGKSESTRAVYRRDVKRFLEQVGQPLREVEPSDVHRFAEALAEGELQASTQNRQLAAVKSLFAFGFKVGYLPSDPARTVPLRPCRDTLNERIIGDEQAAQMIACEPEPRNRALLLTLYGCGVRVSELVGIRVRDLAKRPQGGQVTVYGKGGKTRTILVPKPLWQALAALVKGVHGANAPVFRSRKGGLALSRSQVLRIVRRAARRTGIAKQVSPHWLRHAHASHALDNGAPLHLVQATLGHRNIATTSRYLHARPTESSSNYLTLEEQEAA